MKPRLMKMINMSLSKDGCTEMNIVNAEIDLTACCWNSPGLMKGFKVCSTLDLGTTG